MMIGRTLLAAVEGDSFTGVLRASSGAGVAVGFIADARLIGDIADIADIEVIEVIIELD